MKKIFALAVILALALAGCSDGNAPNNGDNNQIGTPKTTLTIKNECFSELIDVKWTGITFASNRNTLAISSSVTKEVQAGDGYIYFSRKTNPIIARTRELVVVEEGKDNIFRFSDNTVVVESTNQNNIGTLKDLISRVNTPGKPVLKAGNRSINVSWTAISNATQYRVFYGTELTPPATPVITTTNTSTTINGLTNGTTYYVWIQALNDTNESSLSERAQAVPSTDFTANTTAAFLSAIDTINDAGEGTYTITVTGSFTSPFISFTEGAAKTIIIHGDNVKRTITMNEYDGSSYYNGFFSISNGITMEIGNNITLNGNLYGDGTYYSSIVYVSEGGTLIMNNGSTITRAFSSCGIVSEGTFIMNGGEITNCGDAGVRSVKGTFVMNDGTIRNNYTGVVGGNFTMKGGLISGNGYYSADKFSGGGVWVMWSPGLFTKSGGVIDDTNYYYTGSVRVATVSLGGDYKIRTTTAGPNDNLNSSVAGPAGGWD